jgi:hypothetical protein
MRIALLIILLTINLAQCMAQNDSHKIYYKLSDKAKIELEKGIKIIDISLSVFIEISDSDSTIQLRVLNESLLPDSMKNWVKKSNRVIKYNGKEIPIYFATEICFISEEAVDIIGGYLVVIDKEGKFLYSKKQQ